MSLPLRFAVVWSMICTINVRGVTSYNNQLHVISGMEMARKRIPHPEATSLNAGPRRVDADSRWLSVGKASCPGM